MSETTVWAENVANGICKFSEVPDNFKEDVKTLLSSLLDPNAPVPEITHYSFRYKLSDSEKG